MQCTSSVTGLVVALVLMGWPYTFFYPALGFLSHGAGIEVVSEKSGAAILLVAS